MKLPARLALSRITVRGYGNLPYPHILIPTGDLGSLEGTAEPWPCDQLAGCLLHLMHWLAPGCVPSTMALLLAGHRALGLNELYGVWMMLLVLVCQEATLG